MNNIQGKSSMRKRQYDKLFSRNSREKKKKEISDLQNKLSFLETENLLLKDAAYRCLATMELCDPITNLLESLYSSIVVYDPSPCIPSINNLVFVVMCYTQKSCYIVHISVGFLIATGYSQQEVLGRDLRILIGDQTNGDVIKSLNKETNSKLRMLLYKKNKEMFSCLMHVSDFIRHTILSYQIVLLSGIENEKLLVKK